MPPSGDRQSSTFYIGTGGAFAVQVLSAALGLGLNTLLARLLGTIGYGTYALALTWVNVLTVPALLGQTTAVVRIVPQYLQSGAFGALNGLRHAMGIAVFAASTAISLGGAVIVFIFEKRFGPELSTTLYFAFVLLPLLAQLQFSGALHRALKRAASSGAFNALLRPSLLLVVLLGFAFMSGRSVTPSMTMLLSALTALAALLASELSLRAAWPGRTTKLRRQFELRSWFTLGGHLLLLDAIGVVLNRADVLILGALAPPSEVGPYYVAVQLASVASYGLNAANTILAPMIAEGADKNSDHLAGLVRRSSRVSFIITALAAIGAIVLGRWVLGLFGPGFERAYVALIVILAGQCANAAMGPVGYLMTMTRFERAASIIFGGGAILNLVLSVVLIPKFGMVGAAVAGAISTTLWNGAAFVLVWRELGINPTIFSMRL